MRETTHPLDRAYRPPAVQLMRNLGLEPDPWQVQVLEGRHPRLLLNCCRQAGKSTAVALLALAETVFVPGTKVLLLSRSARQSAELFRRVADYHRRMDAPLLQRRTATELELANHSRVISLPCREDTVRGYDAIDLLIIDEAARVPDDLYRAVRPMLAVSGGRLICLSTPFGKRGFFWQGWAKGGDDWQRIAVRADEVLRITPEFLAQELRTLGASYFRQEYECSFEAMEGLVYPDFERCLVDTLPSSLGGEGLGVRGGRPVGGIDFGFRNPFAAVWGVVDREGVLWLTGEHYARQKPLNYHAARLPREVMWYADPSGATERAELLAAGFTVRKGDNTLRLGIAAVTARIEGGTLKVLRGRCPNLVAEAGLYRYDDAGDSEAPADEHNHALAALRYLVSKLDARRMARPAAASSEPEKPRQASPPEWWQRLQDERIWTRLC
ncbi:MAG TPA: terminase family protein [Gemmataceae bacterium]|nr:terminase family protein [Gemmataceae bacterium]